MARLRRIEILKARADGLAKLIEEERAMLEQEMRQAGDMKLIVDEGEALFRSKRKARVTDPKRLAEIVPATVLAEHFNPNVAFVEGLEKAGTDWKSCIELKEGEEFRIERAKTPAAKSYYEQIIEDTKQRAAMMADRVAASVAPPAQNPPANG